MTGIHITCIPFPYILAINYTTLKICNLPRSGRWKTEYQHQESRIPNIENMWLHLNHGSVIDETDTFTVYTLSRHFGHK
jgi:hypothetical protein